MSWAIEREYIPKIGGNDTAPEDEQIRIYFKPFKVGEKTSFTAELMTRSAKIMGAIPEAENLRTRLDEAAKGGGESLSDVCAEMVAMGEKTETSSQEMLRLAFRRVVRGVRGSERVEGWEAVWDAVSDDEDLAADIAGAIMNSAGASKKQRPF